MRGVKWSLSLTKMERIRFDPNLCDLEPTPPPYLSVVPYIGKAAEDSVLSMMSEEGKTNMRLLKSRFPPAAYNTLLCMSKHMTIPALEEDLKSFARR